jgi:O-antigen/teichoic acid export membrane protein
MSLSSKKVAILLAYINIFSSLIIGFIYTPILIDSIGTIDYGLYNYIGSFLSLMNLLSFGVGSSYIRFASTYKDSDKDSLSALNSIYFLFYLFISLLGLVLVIIAYFFPLVIIDSITINLNYDKVRSLILILGLNFVISFPPIIFNSFLVSKGKFTYINSLNLLRTILSPIITIPFLLSGIDVVGLALFVFSINLFIHILLIANSIFYEKINFNFKSINFKIFPSIIEFSFFVFLNIIIEQLLWNTDKIVLGRIIGLTSVAVYSITYLFVEQFKLLSTSISSVFIPTVYTLSKQVLSLRKVSFTNLLIKVGRIQFIILTLFYSGFVIFGYEFIILWLGDNFKDAYYLIIIILPFVLIPITQNLGIEIQRALNLHKFRSLVYFVIAFLNVFLTVYFVFLFGIYGTVISTALSILLGHIIAMNIYYHYKLGLDMIKFWLSLTSLFRPLFFSISLGLFSNQVLLNFFSFNSNILISLVSRITIYSIIYFIPFLFLGLSKDEQYTFFGWFFVLIRKTIKR